MQLAGTGLKGRAAYRTRAWCRAIAALPREGRIGRQTRRALIARHGIASMRELRDWCFPGQPRRHWHYFSITRALKRLGAQRIGWGVYAAK
jgi:hypothetical protein